MVTQQRHLALISGVLERCFTGFLLDYQHFSSRDSTLLLERIDVMKDVHILPPNIKLTWLCG